ncbi:hypothetical protein DFH28DRAFT_929101 [Melampsora americana]|nr:hypothetical protein DFH28DRAFT_929101 [Melampsora americana]
MKRYYSRIMPLYHCYPVVADSKDKSNWANIRSLTQLCHSSLHSTVDNRLKMLSCAQCDLKFRKTHQVNEHRRIMHQSEVMVTINDNKQAIARADDDHFHCPLGDCAYKTPNARYLQDHMSTCKGRGPIVKAKVPIAGDAVLIPVGDEIECNCPIYLA